MRKIVRIKILNQNITTIIQKYPLGTGDAVKTATSLLNDFEGAVLICFADTPFITSKSLKKIEKSFKNGNELVLTGFKKNEENKYGKIIFNKNKYPCEILEDKDAKKNKVFHDYACHSGQKDNNDNEIPLSTLNGDGIEDEDTIASFDQDFSQEETKIHI